MNGQDGRPTWYADRLAEILRRQLEDARRESPRRNPNNRRANNMLALATLHAANLARTASSY